MVSVVHAQSNTILNLIVIDFFALLYGVIAYLECCGTFPTSQSANLHACSQSPDMHLQTIT